MIAREKDSGFCWKFEDFEFCAALTVAYYSSAFANILQNIFDANVYVIFKT
jgi:hypothetical protein